MSWKGHDRRPGIVILLTAELFGLSFVAIGLTHDQLLESGVVSQVSVKLILMNAKPAASEQRLEMHLNQIKELLASHNVASSIKEGNSPSPAARALKERKKP
jgi:hypothetical protein